MFKHILLGAGVLAALLAILIFSGRVPIPWGKKVEAPTGEITIWGTIPQSGIENVLQKFSIEAKTYRVNYEYIEETQFSSKLLNALASGAGPDMILTPYQLILEHRDRVYPFPTASLTSEGYRNFYVDGASILLGDQGALALPISIEPLMLFYNRALFSRHGVITPPTTWDQVTNMVPDLTVLNQNRTLEEHAIALGTYNNIDTAKDILMTLVAQLGQVPVSRQMVGVEERFTILANAPIDDGSEVLPLTTSVRFFTDFANSAKTTYTWNSLVPRAIDQFAAEKLAMYVGYYGDKPRLQTKNARLDFGMKILPQAKGYTTYATGMRMYSIATLKRTSNPFAALTAQSALTGVAYGPVLASVIGGVSPIRTVLAQDTTLDAEVRQSVLIASGWYDAYPLASSQYVQAMISDILSGRSGVVDAVTLFVSRLSEVYTR